MTYSLSEEIKNDTVVEEGRKVYVLDTSVLLSDPNAMYRFEEHRVVIPITVIHELEKKRTDFELGYFARNALRQLESIRLENGGLNEPYYFEDSEGSLTISVQLPEDKNISNDEKIIYAAKQEQHYGVEVVVVSKDLPMRILASIEGLSSEEYRAEIRSTETWSGVESVEVEYEVLKPVFDGEGPFKLDIGDFPVNTGIILKSGTSSALLVYLGDGYYEKLNGEIEVFGVSGRSAEQKIAIAHLLAKDVGIVSLGGKAGTGKTALALLAGLEAVLEEEAYSKIVVFRPLYAVGGQELGYLPGDQDEKMDPWTAAIFDSLGPLVSQNVMEEIKARNLIEILPLTHIRGRSLHDSYVIVDEAQSLERNVLLTVLSRMGQNSKVVLTHDVAQRDNLRVGRYDGIVAVIEALKGNKLFAHTQLRKSERSAIAELVTSLLDF